MRSRIFFASLMTAVLLASVANAGPVYLNLVLNPATTAGGGSTSTQSGANRWHLYAFDDTDGSLGIGAFGISLTNLTGILNRSPRTDWDTDDPDTGPFAAGFHAQRSANDTTAPIAANANPLGGAQPLPGDQPVIVTGFGREASTFAAELPPGSTISAVNQTSPSWGGAYLTAPTNYNPWIFLAEGTFAAGTPVGFSANAAQVRVQVLTAVDNVNGTYSLAEAQEVLNQIPPPPVLNQPPVVGDLNEGDVYRNATQNLGPLPASDPDAGQVLTWSIVPGSFTGQFEGNGGLGYAFSVNPLTGEFTWDAAHDDVSTGPYSVRLRATDNGVPLMSDDGLLSFNVVVPEPASIALFGIAMVGALGLVRRRND